MPTSRPGQEKFYITCEQCNWKEEISTLEDGMNKAEKHSYDKGHFRGNRTVGNPPMDGRYRI